MARIEQGHIVISVDSVSPQTGSANRDDSPTESLASHRKVLEQGRRLLRALNRHCLKATWAVQDPVSSSVVGMLQTSAVSHEIALSGDHDWVSKGRARFAKQLESRVLAARNAGHDVQTLVLTGINLDEGFDLLVKNQISMVRQNGSGNASEARRSTGFRPRSLRFGIWEAPPATLFPTSRSWFGGPNGTLRRALRDAVARTQVAHLAIQLSDVGEKELVALEKWFALLSQYRSERVVQVKTLGELGSHLNQTAQHVSAQSILRKVA